MRKTNIVLDTYGYDYALSVAMANQEQLNALKGGQDAWNAWRLANPRITPDFSKASLAGLKLEFRTDLHDADFSGADLSNSYLNGANLTRAKLRAVNLSGANLRKCNLIEADLQGSNLSSANFHRALLDYANLRNTDLTKASLDVAGSKKAAFHGAKIKDVYYDPDPIREVISNTSFLDLACASGLDELHPDSCAFIEKFVDDVFEFAHLLKQPYTIEFFPGELLKDKAPKIIEFGPIPHNGEAVAEILSQVSLLRNVYDRWKHDSTRLISDISYINLEMMQILKRNPDQIHNLSSRDFEKLIAELLANFGWEVQLTQASKDGGYDIFGIYRDLAGIPHTWIIECKKWAPDRKVGVEIARSLYAVKGEVGAAGALLATTSNFTKGVNDFKTSRYDFETRSYDGIVEWLNAYKKVKTT